MTRKEFLITNILAAGYMALKPALGLLPEIAAKGPEYFVYSCDAAEFAGYRMAMKMVYKDQEYSTNAILVKSLEEPFYGNAIKLMKEQLSVFL